jgi:hypothetical protein
MPPPAQAVCTATNRSPIHHLSAPDPYSKHSEPAANDPSNAATAAAKLSSELTHSSQQAPRDNPPCPAVRSAMHCGDARQRPAPSSAAWMTTASTQLPPGGPQGKICHICRVVKCVLPGGDGVLTWPSRCARCRGPGVGTDTGTGAHRILSVRIP